MATITVQEFRRRLARVEREVKPLVERIARVFYARVGARAVGTYTLPGPKGPVHPDLLTRRSGRLNRAVQGGPGRVQRVEAKGGGRFEVVKGVDTTEVPEALHEVGIQNAFGRGITIDARPFLAPALADEADEVERRAQMEAVRTFRQILSGRAVGPGSAQ